MCYHGCIQDTIEDKSFSIHIPGYLKFMILVEDIDLGVTRQEGRVTPRIITRSPELSFRVMG